MLLMRHSSQSWLHSCRWGPCSRSDLVARLRDCCANRVVGHLAAHDQPAGGEIDVDRVDTRHLGDLLGDGQHAVLARHAVDGVLADVLVLAHDHSSHTWKGYTKTTVPYPRGVEHRAWSATKHKGPCRPPGGSSTGTSAGTCTTSGSTAWAVRHASDPTTSCGRSSMTTCPTWPSAGCGRIAVTTSWRYESRSRTRSCAG